MDEPPIGGIPPFVSAALMLWQLVSVSLPLECRAARHSNGKLTDTNCHSINAGLTNGGIPPIGRGPGAGLARARGSGPDPLWQRGTGAGWHRRGPGAVNSIPL